MNADSYDYGAAAAKRLCVACRHCDRQGLTCGRPEASKGESPVTGRADHWTCGSMRGLGMPCGPDGALFEARPDRA